jgi:acyl dehydratase
VKTITTLDEFEAEYKKGIGVKIDLNKQRILWETTRDNILNFADAVGDNNPLWTDADYARRGPCGMITAPPTFFYNINHGSTPANVGTISAAIKNITLLYAGAEVESFLPIQVGDKFSVTGKAVDIVRKQSKVFGPMLFTTGEAAFYNQDEKLAGLIRTTICRYVTPAGQVLQSDRKPRSRVEVRPPDILAFDRNRRGSTPRYWEDVEEGAEITPLDKGLLTMTEIFRFGILVPPQLRRIERRRDLLEVGFGRESQQKRAGLEDASDYGPQRICWLGQIITDWMGDLGKLKKLSGQIRHPNIIGDSNTLRGKVTNKYVRGNEHLVDCEIWVENQAGLITAPGTATVELPSKES